MANMADGLPSYSLQGGAGGDTSQRNQVSTAFNSSGWTVNTGSGSATGASPATNYMMIGATCLGVLLLWKMSKK